ncbi:replication protein RepA [Corynebacterium hadale]
MAYVITRAVANAGKVKDGTLTIDEACRIPLGHSMNHFLQAIGIGQRGTGGSKGTLTIAREQLLRLAGSMITVKKRRRSSRTRAQHPDHGRLGSLVRLPRPQPGQLH